MGRDPPQSTLDTATWCIVGQTALKAASSKEAKHESVF
ncbi:hypothetical protein A2U01_0054490 [Trifolium medium]|uniref:Uncharacterized protein n=1 Tax=Trifolium medium TaxID=97028 RepID=A0A392R9I9_9FABA|nr:hypothetical protein [Trifolium medium]